MIGTLRGLCAEYGDVNIQLARRPQDIYARARAAVESGHELVIAGGGDGTISGIASVLAGTGCKLGVLPLGTFNYFARRLAIPPDIERAICVCFEGEVRTIPLGDVNGRTFLNNASIGLYPTMLKTREKAYRRIGRNQLSAYVSGLYSLARANDYHCVTMSVGNERNTFRTPLIFAAANAVQVDSFGVPGSGCPQSGKLAFYILPPVGRAALVRLGWRMVMRQLDPGKDFSLVCAERAEVTTRREYLKVAYDGEIEVLRSPLSFCLRPNALNVMCPPGLKQDSVPA